MHKCSLSLLIATALTISILNTACDDAGSVMEALAKTSPQEQEKATPSKGKEPKDTNLPNSYFPLIDGSKWKYDIVYQGETIGKAEITITKNDETTFIRSSQASFNTTHAESTELSGNVIGTSHFHDTFIKEGSQIKLIFSSAEVEASSPNATGNISMSINYSVPIVVLKDETKIEEGEEHTTQSTVDYNAIYTVNGSEKATLEDKDIEVEIGYYISGTEQIDSYSTYVQEFSITTNSDITFPYSKVWLAKGIGPVKMKGNLLGFAPFGIQHDKITLILKEYNIPETGKLPAKD